MRHDTVIRTCILASLVLLSGIQALNGVLIVNAIPDLMANVAS